MNMNPANACGKCYYFVSATGVCHFAPPTAVAIGTNIKTIRPQVTSDTRACGSFVEVAP